MVFLGCFKQFLVFIGIFAHLRLFARPQGATADGAQPSTAAAWLGGFCVHEVGWYCPFFVNTIYSYSVFFRIICIVSKKHNLCIIDLFGKKTISGKFSFILTSGLCKSL